MNENDEKNCLEKMFDKDENRQYKKYTIEITERIGLKFDIFKKFNKINNNVEIFLFTGTKMKIKKFYTILYLLEYFRVEYDNKLRNAIKIIWFSLMESNEMNNFDIKNPSFHFSKQDYFSNALFKKISQEFLKLLNNGKEQKFLWIFTDDRKHMLVINYNFDAFFYKKVVVNHKSQCLFLVFLNTLNIKYLHIKSLNRANSKSFCFILDNLKKRIDEIVICSLNANLNLVNLKKIVFIFPEIKTSFIFRENLAKIIEFIFFEKNDDEKYAVHAIKEEDLNIADTYTNNKNKNIPKENRNFYLKILNEDNYKGKVRIIEYFECMNKNLQVKFFCEYKRSLNIVSISFYELNDKQFFTTENTILKDNIKCIKISSSEIKSDLLRDILNIKGLESLEINKSDNILKMKFL
ncbi:hypothetical protein CWI36_0513p0020 [Hamiltosporidium magnivora]|uniref:Uncharacterized protein n=1 Tax=Hamiltosporidium magnivora TaxID=148818 RepID=A0A4V2JW08_9MICR|nr:hypothetical protein CWI36_0513p0020 [Hamiltosporidium magnivora]